MADELKISVIGLDTSHAVEFPRRIQSPEIDPGQRVEGMRVVACNRFKTPFTDDKTLAERTAQLESWGVKVTDDFDEAVKGCDALIVSINDPARHLEYFTRAAELGVPMFLDKPMADTYENGKKIAEVAAKQNVRFFTSSSLRYVDALSEACSALPEPSIASVYGALGKALSGSSIVWYGCHAFEMLERAMGTGATSLTCTRDAAGAVAVVSYPNNRRGVVELTEGSYLYGGTLRTKDSAHPYLVDMSTAYSNQLRRIVAFFRGEDAPMTIDDSLEIMKLLDAAERSAGSGKTIDLTAM